MTTDAKPLPNWLVRQILAARKETESWPVWKRDAYRAALNQRGDSE